MLKNERLGDKNVDGDKNTDASMVFDTDVESRVCASHDTRTWYALTKG